LRIENYFYLLCMRRHNGMRPQDSVILLKIITLGSHPWQLKDLAQSLFISPSEVSESLNRSVQAGLIDHRKKRVNRQAFYEFLVHGLPYVFPQEPGRISIGLPTAHAHPAFRKSIITQELYVWPELEGKERGAHIEPCIQSRQKLQGKMNNSTCC
jgi:hypothetical protein